MPTNKEYIQIIEQALRSYLPGQEGLEADVCRAMEYSLMGGRKADSPHFNFGILPDLWR